MVKGQQSADKRFKGVRMRSWGRWVSEIRLPHTRARLWLGSYSSPQQAARAYDVALRCLRGPSAALNFPDSPPAFAPFGASHRHIQELAAAAASSPPSSPSSPSVRRSPPPLSSPSSSSSTDLSSRTPPLSSPTLQLSSRRRCLQHDLPFSPDAHTSCEHSSSRICRAAQDEQALPSLLNPFPSHDPALSSTCNADSSLETQELTPTEICDPNFSPGLSSTELFSESSAAPPESLFHVPKWDFFTPLLDGTFDNCPWLFDASECMELTMCDPIVPREKFEDELSRVFDPYLWSS